LGISEGKELGKPMQGTPLKVLRNKLATLPRENQEQNTEQQKGLNIVIGILEYSDLESSLF
jgi:hypothetical protein